MLQLVIVLVFTNPVRVGIKVLGVVEELDEFNDHNNSSFGNFLQSKIK